MEEFQAGRDLGVGDRGGDGRQLKRAEPGTARVLQRALGRPQGRLGQAVAAWRDENELRDLECRAGTGDHPDRRRTLGADDGDAHIREARCPPGRGTYALAIPRSEAARHGTERHAAVDLGRWLLLPCLPITPAALGVSPPSFNPTTLSTSSIGPCVSLLASWAGV